MISAPKILIVDDSNAACLFMTAALQKAGYDVQAVYDGNAALTQVLKQPPHCLVLDILLPGLNGYVICRRVREMDPQHKMPIILISTKSSPLDQNYGLGLGADRYLPKPFAAETLVQLVGELLPPRYQAARAPFSSAPKPQNRVLDNLVPRYREDSLSNTPFSSFLHMDHPTRLVYGAIDGRKTVKGLSSITKIEPSELLRILQTLWQQQRIEFYDQDGHRVADFSF